jgi:hypothetical protein
VKLDLTKSFDIAPTALLRSFSSVKKVLPWLVLAIIASRSAAAQEATSLVMQTIKNEEASRHSSEHLFYVSEERSTRTGGHLWKERTVQLGEGALRRLVEIDGIPLTPEKAQAEEQRITRLAADPEAFRKSIPKHDHNEDLSSVAERAFLFTYDGQSRGCTRIRFVPQPSFKPAGYEQAVLHSMEGTVAIKEPEARLCDVNAHLRSKVEIVHGIVGSIERGGQIQIKRSRMADGTWQLTSLNIHIEGNILFLRSISQNNDVTRTDIRVLPADTTLAQAAILTKP